MPSDVANHVLIVEDSNFFRSLLQRNLVNDLNLELIFASSMQEAVEVIEENHDKIFVSVLDLTLPDAEDVQIVDRMKEYEVPMIVFTATYKEDLRDRILSRPVIDYVIKDNPLSL